MAQGTGQTRRRQAGKDKASGSSSSARTRGSGTARSASRSSSNGRANASRAKAGASPRKQKVAAAASRPRAATTRRAHKQTGSGSALEVARGGARKIVRAGAGKVVRAGALEAARKLALPTAKRVGGLAAAVRPAAAPLGATGAVVLAGVAARAVQHRRQDRRSRIGARIRGSRPSLKKSRPVGIHTAAAIAQQAGQRAKATVGQAGKHARPVVADFSPRRQELLWMAAVQAGLRAAPIIGRARRLPIQQSIDIAVPLEVAYEEWMKLEFLPEGCQRVENIERTEGGTLTGRLRGRAWSRRWEAEIRDERDGESFAWRSVRGSDCAGLVTFHRLGDRLTRLELQLDVVPVKPSEALDFALRLADARTRAELRRFKARLETINPDAYGEEDDPEIEDENPDEDEQDDHNHKEG